MLYAQKKSTNCCNSSCSTKIYLRDKFSMTVYSIGNQESIYSLNIEENRHLFLGGNEYGT